MTDPETPADWVARTRTQQGLTPQLDDPATVKRVHYLLSTTRPRRKGGAPDAAA